MLQLATQVLAVQVFRNVLGGLSSGEPGKDAPSVWAGGLSAPLLVRGGLVWWRSPTTLPSAPAPPEGFG